MILYYNVLYRLIILSYKIYDIIKIKILLLKMLKWSFVWAGWRPCSEHASSSLPLLSLLSSCFLVVSRLLSASRVFSSFAHASAA